MKKTNLLAILALSFVFCSCEDELEQAKRDIKEGLIAYYTFDNGDAKDSSGSGYHGVLLNNPTFTSETTNGKGQALFLNGIKEQFVNIPYNPFQGLDAYSVSMWVKDFGVAVLFSAVGGDDLSRDYPRLMAGSDEAFIMHAAYAYNNEPPFAYQYKPLQNGEWHMITIVVASGESSYEDKKYLYVDGMLVDASQATIDKESGCTKMHIGGDNSGKCKAFSSSMKVDNIRFYDRALEAIEVEAIYAVEK